MPKLRLQDFLFGILGLVLLALMTFHIAVIVLALVGAFACGAIYIFVGMIPSREESFGHRLFVTVFLSVVMSSVVLILPGTFGAHAFRADVRHAAFAIAVLLPAVAICFEVLRTPRVIRGILRCFGYR